MALTESSVKRARDNSGDSIKTFLDSSSREIQAIALVDADGTHTYFSVVGDGTTADLEDDDGTTGTTKGVALFGIDYRNKMRFPRVDGNGNLLVQLRDSTLTDILKELKKITLQLSLISGEHITNEEILDA